ncbi:MAG: hypothetical protein FJ008_03260 [Chloroflexi bacterium]|nr:hypothetical protein [Chloroflexota bacterium]MBM3173447.1 hypothetical protein [Chloroflexota bacterium]MBM3174458.1 hypothetical protein [Chloroflexota bacterium]MBM4449592.1 hypothetical protein [Chloroflexota bacterium]
MMCPKCQTQNPDTAEYCENCEAKLVRSCPSCGHRNPYSYVFCGECGQKLDGTQVPQQPATPAQAPVAATASQPSPTVKWEVMPVAPVRISTGIQGLDPLIGSGFPANKVYLVSGEAGTGKTIFGLQFIFGGLILGDGGVYVSGDEKANHIFSDAWSLGWDFARYVESKKLAIMDVSPRFADLRAGRAKHIDTRALVSDLTKQVKAVGARRIVIDPVAPLVYGEQSSIFVQEHIRNLVLEIEDSLQCTTLITSDIVAGTPSLSRYGVEEFVTEGVIILGMSKQNGQRVRTLSVRKMRSTAADIQDHVFDILPHRGIVLGT